MHTTSTITQDKLTGDHTHTTGNVAGTGMTDVGATRTAGVTTGTTAGTTTHHAHQPVGDKIKQKLHMGSHGPTSAAAGEHLVGGVPVTRKDSSSSSSSDEEGKVVGAGQTYTAVEERDVIKDHVTVIKQHNPVEHQYVTEVKEVGVRELPTRVEHLGTTEKIIEGTGVATTGQGAVHSSTQTGASGMMSGSSAHDTTTTRELK